MSSREIAWKYSPCPTTNPTTRKRGELDDVAAMQHAEVGQHRDGEDERGTVDAHSRQFAWRDACVDHEPGNDAVRRSACRRDRHEGIAEARDG